MIVGIVVSVYTEMEIGSGRINQRRSNWMVSPADKTTLFRFISDCRSIQPALSSTKMNSPFPLLPMRANSESNSLQYAIYPIKQNVKLRNVLDFTLDLMSTWTDNYIWNLDPFNLHLDPTIPKLHGNMDMGEDSVVSLDEWVVVGAFWQVSKRFPDVAIRFSLL